jgi:hypothetical protein
MRPLILPFLVICSLLALTGCAQETATSSGNKVRFQGYEAYAYHGESSADADYIRFRLADGVEEFTINLPRELPRLVLQYEARIESGRIVFKVINPDGKAILGGNTDENGHLKLYYSLRVPAGTYTVRTEYRQARNGEIRYIMYGYYH